MSDLSSVWARVTSVYRARGAAGFALFALRRLVRRQGDLVFERTLLPAPAPAPVAALDGLTVTVVDHSNILRPELAGLLDQVLRGEGAMYRQELTACAVLFAVCDAGGRVMHYSFVQYDGRYKRILNEEAEVPLFTNCFTDPVARGRGLYPRTLRLACDWLAARGAMRALITCDPGNFPSIRGIERAGFVRRREVRSLIVLSRLAIQRIDAVDGNTRLRATRV